MCLSNCHIKKLRSLKGSAFFFGSFFISTSTIAQVKDSATYDLNEVVISSIKAEKFAAGKKILKTDSALLSNFSNTNLGDLLAITSPVFVKNYGPGNIATTSFRGGNASQTAILWNGVNIQNQMLAQSDLSILPNFVFDEVSIDYGGGSALWGSGAMGGSINLNNKVRFNKGLITSINAGYGSFGTHKINCGIHYSNSKISSNTKVYYTQSQNNYTYLDTVIKKRIHSDYVQKGVMQEIAIPFLTYHKLTARAWYHTCDRNLPPALNNKISKASQLDEDLKLMLDWTYQKNNFIPAIKIAYLNDKLNYNDSNAGIFSKSNIKTFIAEAETYYQINSHHKLYIGGNYTNYFANYIDKGYFDTTFFNKGMYKEAILLGYANSFLENKFQSNINLRQEFSSVFSVPLTGNVGISYSPIKLLTLKVNAAKVYRQPSLNDLYWPNGGNINLKPEEGYTYEGGLALNVPLKKFLLQTEITYYDKQIQNWIAWIPGPNGNSTPLNLLKVHSRGSETSSSISYLNNKLKIKLAFNSAYTLSGVTESSLAYDESINKQLIYTPRYNYGGQFVFSYGDFSFYYFHNYIGYRYTTSDNTSWLKPYQIVNAKISYSAKLSKLTCTWAFHFNNIYNTSYFVYEQRPMPLRNYEISVTLSYHKPNKTKNNN